MPSTTKGTAMNILHRLGRVYRDFDYVNRRSLELRTGVDVIDPWERFARSPRRP